MSSPQRGRPRETARYIKYLLPVENELAPTSNHGNDVPTTLTGTEGYVNTPSGSAKFGKGAQGKQHLPPARAAATVTSAALVHGPASNTIGAGGTRLAATSSQKEQQQKVKQYIQHQHQLQQQQHQQIHLQSPNVGPLSHSSHSHSDVLSPDFNAVNANTTSASPVSDYVVPVGSDLSNALETNVSSATRGALPSQLQSSSHLLGTSNSAPEVLYGHVREGSATDAVVSPPPQPLGFPTVGDQLGKYAPMNGSFALHGSFTGSPPMSGTNSGPAMIVSKKAFKPTAAAAYQKVRELDWRKRERDSTPMHAFGSEEVEEDNSPPVGPAHSPHHYRATSASSRTTSPATSAHHGGLTTKRSFRNTSALRPHEAVEVRKLSIGTDGTFHIGATQYGSCEGTLAAYPVPALAGSGHQRSHDPIGSVPKQRPVYKQVKHRGVKYRKILDAALNAAVDETEAQMRRHHRLRRKSSGAWGTSHQEVDDDRGTDPVGKEASRRFAEKIARNPFNPLFTTSHGTTLNLPPVAKSLLPSVLGGAGAVRHKGTQHFSTHLPPPRLVTHEAIPIAPKGAIYRAGNNNNNKGASITAPGLIPEYGAVEHSPGYAAMSAELQPSRFELPAATPTESSALLGITPPNPFEATFPMRHADYTDNAEDEEEEEEDEDDDDEYEVISYTDSAADLMLFVVPAAVNYALSMLLVVLPLGYVGSHRGQHALSATAAGYYFASIVALYPLHGLLFAIDTLCANAYGNDSESNVMGLIFQRGLALALGGLVVVLSLLTVAAEPLLRLFYSKELAGDILEFVTYSPLYLVCTVIVVAFSKFLSSQMAPSIPMLATVVGVLVTIAWQSHFAVYGIRWVAVGMGVATLCQLLTITFAALSRPQIRKTLGTLRLREALQLTDVSSFLQIALPSSLFIALDSAAYDVTVLMAAGMGDGPGSAWAALMSYEYLLTFAAAGLSAAACAKVGAAIGANQPINAKTYAWTAISLAVAWGVIFIWPAFITFYRELIGTMGGSLAETRKVHLWYPLLLLLDLVESTCQGIFSGANAYHLGAPLFAAAMWGIGIPLAAVLSSGLVLRIANYLNGHGFVRYVMPPKSLAEYQQHTTHTDKKKGAQLAGGSMPNQRPHRLTYPPSVVQDYIEQNSHNAVVASFEPYIGIRGLGVGFTVGLLVLCVLLLRAVIKMDWDGLAFQSQVEDEEDDEDEEDEELEEEEDEEEEYEPEERDFARIVGDVDSPMRGYQSRSSGGGAPQLRNIVSVRK